MKTFTVFKALGPLDLKNVQRDSLLLWIPSIPLIMALVIRLGIPIVAQVLLQRTGFNLVAYYPLVMSTFVLLTPTTVGMIVGFLLLDERDDRMLTALLITPMPLRTYLLYRISIPMLFAVAATLIGFPIAGLTTLPFVDLLLITCVGSLIGPQVALFLAAFSRNKVAGFAMLKLLNAILMLPIVAFFIPSNWQLLVGIIPAYWPLKAFWSAAGEHDYWLYLLVALLVNGVALVVLLKRFTVVVHR